MDDLIALMERYRPGVGATLRPTPEADIARITALAGPLPGAYLRFLQTMGASTGDLEIDRGNAALSSTNIWYVHESKTWLRGSRYLYIGQDNDLSAYDYFLDRKAPHADDDCGVVRMPLQYDVEEHDVRRVHAGLEEMLYYEAFYQLRLSQFAHQRGFDQLHRGPEPARWQSPALIFSLAEDLGFRRIPPATRSALYERGDAALLLYQTPDVPAFSFIVAADDASEMGRMTEAFVGTGAVTLDPNPVF